MSRTLLAQKLLTFYEPEYASSKQKRYREEDREEERKQQEKKPKLISWKNAADRAVDKKNKFKRVVDTRRALEDYQIELNDFVDFREANFRLFEFQTFKHMSSIRLITGSSNKSAAVYKLFYTARRSLEHLVNEDVLDTEATHYIQTTVKFDKTEFERILGGMYESYTKNKNNSLLYKLGHYLLELKQDPSGENMLKYSTLKDSDRVVLKTILENAASTSPEFTMISMRMNQIATEICLGDLRQILNEMLAEKDRPSTPLATSTAILKSQKHSYSDNSVYEYVAGLCINQFSNRFPCFVQTYALFRYETEEAKNTLSDKIQTLEQKLAGQKLPIPQRYSRQNIQSETVEMMRESVDCIDSCEEESHPELKQNRLQRLKTNLTGKGMCTHSTLFSVLSQTVDNEVSFEKFISKTSTENTAINSYKVCCALLQVYAPLYFLQSEFTHYDLHWENVLLSLPQKGKYIKFVYHYQIEKHQLSDDAMEEDPEKYQVEIYSQHMAKMIDYGHSFCKDADTFIEYALDESNGCDGETGFKWFNTSEEEDDCEHVRKFVCADRANASSDLLLLYAVGLSKPDLSKSDLSKSDLLTTILKGEYEFGPEQFHNKRKTVSHINGRKSYLSLKETKPSEKPAENAKKIENIKDAFFALKHLCEEWKKELSPQEILSMETNHELTIHVHQQPDKRMRFEFSKMTQDEALIPPAQNDVSYLDRVKHLAKHYLQKLFF